MIAIESSSWLFVKDRNIKKVIMNGGALLAAFATISLFHSPSLVDGHGYCKVRNDCSHFSLELRVSSPNNCRGSFSLLIYNRFLHSLFAALLLHFSIKTRRLPVLVTTTLTTSFLRMNALPQMAVLRPSTVRIATTTTLAYVASPRT
jgi:hypothetical protein